MEGLRDYWAVGIAVVVVVIVSLKWSAKRLNVWWYEAELPEEEIRQRLPPGDYGFPIIGNMWSFLSAFKSDDPDSFLRTFISRYGGRGVYKGLMFGRPSVFVTTPETCRKVLNDDESFKPGWPTSTVELMGKNSFLGISPEDHKRLRRLSAAPVNGHEALSLYMGFIGERVSAALEEWSSSGEPLELLTHLRKLTFKIIMYIFLGSESEDVMEILESQYTAVNHGVRAMAINFPGFAYHKALKARKKVVAVLQSVLDERRNRIKHEDQVEGESENKEEEKKKKKKKDMMDELMRVEDENGRRLRDEEIIDILLMYLNAGHESSAHVTMWATVLLHQHPHCLQKAREEQEEIVKRRPVEQNGALTFKEIRQMDYLSKVIDETLRIVTFSLTVFREAKTNVDIGGYMIPKGWRVLVWFRNVHLDDEIFPKARDFDPSRWDNHTPKAGSFLPFGAGSYMCPGNDLAKIEIAAFLHYFLINYEMERVNPECPTRHLPHPRPKDNCLAWIKKKHPTSTAASFS
ncbi:Ent-kaurenoic acid oxidase 1 [Linum perenne]